MAENQKLLLSMVGAMSINGEPRGFMSEGMCIPLAATGDAMEMIQQIGEDAVAPVIEGNDIDPPKSGGLWVLECSIFDDSDCPQGFRIEDAHWRMPSENELFALLLKQNDRIHRSQTPIAQAEARWTYNGALV